ncbi:B3 domain-containing protein Os01g0905400 isoform X2 [Medicago truncatula]|uniref:B3 domain-containing protein Os01g0905400 isoform X2 n=1 Tax=Medicago truncatula TaxID=3880 RepID=UPI000D2F3CB9|nr:B3 domain-containing protein Os01g0905400 isoform X2 [Medicago truncatula]
MYDISTFLYSTCEAILNILCPKIRKGYIQHFLHPRVFLFILLPFRAPRENKNSAMVRNQQVKVCSSCTHHCRFFDHFQRTKSTSPNSFYNLMLYQRDFQVLDLPSKLNPTMSLLVDQKINLEDSTGKRWAITVSEVDGSFAFKKGWDDFSSAHKLEIGDLLVFNCINKYNFDVKIYDQSMCERIDFSDKRKRKKRSRCSSGSLDAGGTPNSVEVVSENVNVDRSVKCPRTSEDTSYIRNHVYLNDAAIFNNDPMFEEVLGSGDTSYASKFGLLDRKDFFWSQVQDSQVTESLERPKVVKGELNRDNSENRSIISNGEVQECQLGVSLGPISVELLDEMTNDLDAQMHIELPKPNVIKGEINQDIKSHFETAATISCENTRQRFNEMSNLSDDQSHLGVKKKMPMEMTPNLFICNEKLNATGPPEIIIKKEYNEDETVTCVVLADNSHLKLSECLPLSRAGLRSKRMVVILKDALERLWPVLCLEQTSLTSGWPDFRIANNIKSGDACDFRVEDKSKCIVAVDIHHK